MTLIDKAEALAILDAAPNSKGGLWAKRKQALHDAIAALPARGVGVKPDAAEMLAKEMQAIVAADRWKGRDLSAAPPEKWSHLRPETQQFWIDTAARILAALPARGVGVPAEDIDALAYRFWSIHPKDIPEAVGMPEDYKGGKRAWFMATEIRRILAALSPAPVEAQAREAALREAAGVAYDYADVRHGHIATDAAEAMRQPAHEIATAILALIGERK